MNNYYFDLERKIMGLLDNISMSISEKKEVYHFIEHGEYGVALETLLFICIEEKKVISAQSKVVILNLQQTMGIALDEDIQHYLQ